MRLQLVILAFLLAGCTGYVVNELPSEEGLPPAIFFCKQDDCGAQLEYVIRSGKESVHCAFYDLSLHNIIDALGEKSAEIEVRIVLDNEPYKGKVAGSNVVLENRSSRMHNKFCVVDGKYVWTGSFNPTYTGNEENEENGILIGSSLLAKNYGDEFDELWSKKFSGGKQVEHPVVSHSSILIENYFCPEDRCEEEAIREIKDAKHSILFMTFSFTSQEIAEAILLSDAKDIRGVFEKSQAGSQYSQDDRIEGFGIPVKRYSGKGVLHHKVFIIDNTTVITGSYNPTSSGDERNDENVLIIHDREAAQEFLDEFDRLWVGID